MRWGGMGGCLLGVRRRSTVVGVQLSKFLFLPLTSDWNHKPHQLPQRTRNITHSFVLLRLAQERILYTAVVCFTTIIWITNVAGRVLRFPRLFAFRFYCTCFSSNCGASPSACLNPFLRGAENPATPAKESCEVGVLRFRSHFVTTHTQHSLLPALNFWL